MNFFKNKIYFQIRFWLHYFYLFLSIYYSKPTNYNFFEKKLQKKFYIKPTLKLNHLKYCAITGRIREVYSKMTFTINPDYFRNLENYYDFKIRFMRIYGPGITKYYALNPAYIPMLDYIIRKKLIRKGERNGGGIIEYGAGLGNFLPYLSVHIDEDKLFGIDDYSQITKKEIETFQKKTFKFQIKKKAPFNLKYKLIITVGVPIIQIAKQIILYKPKYILCETRYLGNQYIQLKEICSLLKKYKITRYNEIFLVLVRK